MTATLIEPQTSIITAICNEPEGTFVRHVYPMALSLENLHRFWEKASQFRTVFNSDVRGDFKAFCELFLSLDGNIPRAHGLFWVIDDFVGLYYMTHLSDHDCQVHYTFFDKRHKGREELTREMLRYAFRTFGFQRMTVEIPLYASRNTFGFTHAIGFKKEGVRRKCIKYKDDWFDAACFGLLRSEALPDNGS